MGYLLNCRYNLSMKHQKLRVLAPFLATLTLISVAAPSFGWGVVGHRYANGLAVDSLPDSLKNFYAPNRAWIVAHSSDPDQWRNKDRSEAPHHFIDLDFWGMDAVKTFPTDYWTACGLYGKAAVDKNGTVPWRIAYLEAKLTKAFREKDAKGIIEISAFLGHYVADTHVPFHAATNYDGQLTGQKGIHARFESVMVERQIKDTDLKPLPLVHIDAPAMTAIEWAKVSLNRSFEVLVSDKESTAKDAQYGDVYYTELGKKCRPIALNALQESGRDLASLWVSAWEAAGKPVLPAPSDVHSGEPLDKPTTDPDTPAKPETSVPVQTSAPSPKAETPVKKP